MLTSTSRLLLLTITLISIIFYNCSESTESIEETTYEIGDSGPSGGFIFYDKGETTNGWRYMEAAPSDLAGSEWGCFNNPVVQARELGIGKGLQNSMFIVNFHDGFNDFYNNPSECSSMSNGTVAAKICLDLSIGSFDDWHLPSEEEGFLMYENLHLQGLGNFSATETGIGLYWTSTEHDDNTATAIDFTTGDGGWLCKQCDGGQLTKIRAVRYF